MTDSPGQTLALSVLVPVERHTLGVEALRALHDELRGHLQRISEEFEVIYLIGHGNREMRDAIRTFHQEDSRIRLVEFGRVVAYTALIATGMEKARGRLLLIAPPYFDVDLKVIGKLYSAIEEGADVAIAARRAPLGSRLFNRVVASATGTRFTDIASGTRIMRRETLHEIPLYGDLDRYLPVLAERLGWVVREVPAEKHPRRHRTKGTPLGAFWRLMDVLSLFFISRFTRRPLRLLGSVGVTFGFVGFVILSVAVLERFMLDKPLGDRPVLVLGALLVGLGVQTLTIGLLGELIIFFQARKIRDYRVFQVHETHPPAIPKQQTEAEGSARGESVRGTAGA